MSAAFLESLAGQRLAVLGMGLENGALARFLMAHGLRFTVCDAAAPPPLEVLRQELGAAVDGWRLGPAYLQDIDGFDVIFRTPGISALRPELVRAQQRGARLCSQTRLFAALCPAPLVGVTGTKGKGTTSSILAAILERQPDRRTWLAGNIGKAPIAFVDEIAPHDRVVLELSSFQLMDWDRSPQVAVVLNVTQDHLDYHADRDEYVAAKRNILRYQTPQDTLVVDWDCPTSRSFAAGAPARVLAFSARTEVEAGAWIARDRLWTRRPGGVAAAACRADEVPLRGRHNVANAAAAAAAAVAVGVPADEIGAGIRSFRGLEHRLERVALQRGVLYFNDSLATTPDSAMAALEAFDEPVVLIAGGSPKGADFSALAACIARRQVRAAVLLGQEAPRLAAALRQAAFPGEIVTGCQSMHAAVGAARLRAQPGDVVLLSPACASFGMFTSYRDRGEQFRRSVQALG